LQLCVKSLAELQCGLQVQFSGTNVLAFSAHLEMCPGFDSSELRKGISFRPLWPCGLSGHLPLAGVQWVFCLAGTASPLLALGTKRPQP